MRFDCQLLRGLLTGPRWLSVWGLITIGGAGGVACGGPCDGDRVAVDGVCVPRCSDETCSEGMACVHSVCRPMCKRDSDCAGEDICESIRTDEGKSGKYCYGLAVDPSPYASAPETGATSGSSTLDPTSEPDSSQACEESADCAQTALHHCVQQKCETACTLHEHCGRAGACSGSGTSAEGDVVTYCEQDDFPRAAGQYGSDCLTESSSCDAEAGFRCISAGDGDTASYCAQAGCEGDEQCPSGYFCSDNRITSRSPCEPACGLVGSAAVDCIPSEDIGPGKPYDCAEGGGLVLSLCLKRSFCAACDTDADCRGEPNQLCARGPDGVKMCTVLCAPGQDSCPWGAATECDVFDEDLGLATCGHRFGACKGTGRSCEPCIHDGDCPTGFCAKSGFSGELFCFDSESTCACDANEDICVGGGCPSSPSGKAMNCVSTGDGAPPSACYGAEIDEVAGTPLGCW